MKQVLSAIISLLFLCSVGFSQNIGIGTNTPHPSAALEIADSSKGILIPRMTMAQRNAIQNPAEGLMVYQTNDSLGFWFYSGHKWLQINSKGIKGDQGVQGDSGISVRNTSVLRDSLFITLSNGQTINAGNVRGLTGAQGPTGLLLSGQNLGNIPFWNSNSWNVSSDNLFHDGFKVRIGSDATQVNQTANLQVSKSIEIRDTLDISTTGSVAMFNLWKSGNDPDPNSNHMIQFSRGVYPSHLGAAHIKSTHSTTSCCAKNLEFATAPGNVSPGAETKTFSLLGNGANGFFNQPGSGLILKSANGTCYKITISNSGSLITSLVTCP